MIGNKGAKDKGQFGELRFPYTGAIWSPVGHDPGGPELDLLIIILMRLFY